MIVMASASRTSSAGILALLYVAEAGVASILVGVYKAPSLDATVVFTKSGIALAAGGAALIAASWVLARGFRSAGSMSGRAVSLAVATNLLSIIAVLLLAEGLLRGMARETPAGVFVGRVKIRPTWRELVARSRRAITAASPSGAWSESYFVYDRDLGWTVGAGRSTSDGLYCSSVEGIRSAAPGVRVADTTPRFRVALVGDSNAFSLEVPFEESWGHHLRRLLDEGTQVLNFGVDGYGLDQMYLRYERDVRRWKPAAVVIGFCNHDLLRATAVYPFVTFGWPGYLVKPRFVVDEGRLARLNARLPDPEEILGADRIEELPWIQYDLGYASSDWSWRSGRGPLFLRFLTSAFPRWPHRDPRFSRLAIAELNGRLLAELVRSIERDGAIPLVVHFSNVDLPVNPAVRQTLAIAGVSPVPIARCLAEVPADRRMTPSGHHFTGTANMAIARCTAPAIAAALGPVGDSAARPSSSSESARW